MGRLVWEWLDGEEARRRNSTGAQIAATRPTCPPGGRRRLAVLHETGMPLLLGLVHGLVRLLSRRCSRRCCGRLLGAGGACPLARLGPRRRLGERRGQGQTAELPRQPVGGGQLGGAGRAGHAAEGADEAGVERRRRGERDAAAMAAQAAWRCLLLLLGVLLPQVVCSRQGGGALAAVIRQTLRQAQQPRQATPHGCCVATVQSMVWGGRLGHRKQECSSASCGPSCSR